MIVLDASVLISYLVATDRHHRRAEALLARLVEDDLGMGPLTLAEMLVVPTWEGRAREVLLLLEELEIRELPLLAGAPVELARLRSETGLKLPDCCVLLAATQHGGHIVSFDDKLAAAARALDLEYPEI